MGLRAGDGWLPGHSRQGGRTRAGLVGAEPAAPGSIPATTRPMKTTALRRAAFDANRALDLAGLAVLTFGNASVLDRVAGLLAIKPSGIPARDLVPEDIVL